MFYGEGSDKPLFLPAQDDPQQDGRRTQGGAGRVVPVRQGDIKGTLEAMEGLPVTIRLLDPPLHEFVPQDAEEAGGTGRSLGITADDVEKRGEALHETNPMMGHRGVRLGITYPEVTEMQVRAIFEAAAELIKAGKKAKPEIMIPVTCDVNELEGPKGHRRGSMRKSSEKSASNDPASLRHDDRDSARLPAGRQDGQEAEFFSFGTNDLTQMGFGFSRDDIGGVHGRLPRRRRSSRPIRSRR